MIGINLDGLGAWGGLGVGEGEPADVVVAGIPYDGSAVYRKGAALAPARIRALSPIMPPVTEAGASLVGLRVRDIGDIDAGPDIEAGWRAVADRLASIPQSSFLTVIGGDHCVGIPILAAQSRRHPDLVVVWVDSHPDLCDFSRGGRWTCGCALRRGLEVAAIEPGRALLAGGRDFDLEEVEFARQNGMLNITTQQLARDPRAAGREIAHAAAGRPVHVSFDIDVLDPAFAPGTEIPSGGGISTREALDLLAAISEGSQVVGLDITEVSPPFDTGDITSLAALKVIFEFWGMVWKRPM